MPYLPPYPLRTIPMPPGAVPGAFPPYPSDQVFDWRLLRQWNPSGQRGLLDRGPDISPMLPDPRMQYGQQGQGISGGLLGPGMLQKVIWDRIRQQPGLGLLGTEGAARGSYGGGGRGMLQTELPLQGGETYSRNVRMTPPEPSPYEPKYKWQSAWGGDTHVATLPSGVRVQIDKMDNGYADVVFYRPGARITRQEQITEGTSTKRGISRLSDVFDAVRDYVKAFNPKGLEFSAATPAHEKLYDKVAPQIASELGGRLVTNSGFYRIHLPGGAE